MGWPLARSCRTRPPESAGPSALAVVSPAEACGTWLTLIGGTAGRGRRQPRDGGLQSDQPIAQVAVLRREPGHLLVLLVAQLRHGGDREGLETLRRDVLHAVGALAHPVREDAFDLLRREPDVRAGAFTDRGRIDELERDRAERLKLLECAMQVLHVRLQACIGDRPPRSAALLEGVALVQEEGAVGGDLEHSGTVAGVDLESELIACARLDVRGDVVEAHAVYLELRGPALDANADEVRRHRQDRPVVRLDREGTVAQLPDVDEVARGLAHEPELGAEIAVGGHGRHEYRAGNSFAEVVDREAAGRV